MVVHAALAEPPLEQFAPHPELTAPDTPQLASRVVRDDVRYRIGGGAIECVERDQMCLLAKMEPNAISDFVVAAWYGSGKEERIARGALGERDALFGVQAADELNNQHLVDRKV
jgi:hypothetical protein